MKEFVLTINDADVPTTVPRYEQGIIDAEARRRRVDCEKVATTPVTKVVIEGIRITSRYRKADEFDRLIRFVAALPHLLRGSVTEIFCDSKSGVVSVATWDSAAAIEAVYENLFGYDYECQESDGFL